MSTAFEKAFENFCDIYNSFVLFSSEYTQQINTLNELKRQIDDVDLLIQQSYQAYRLKNMDKGALEKFEWHNHHKRLLEGQMAGVTDTCSWLIERYGEKMGWVVTEPPTSAEEHASVESDPEHLNKTVKLPKELDTTLP
ncbi:hypothetical protein RF11_03451 [Thelohanellus kitauei]|uniref:Uncharacterized protein n=1 Tax=Thelohanellus kitauei TaxID=669202 RepID=A0A0C2IXG3_THEKT|nr:hypothetical protein RF11_03451 [Thelohanellus kitauei]